MSGGYPAAGTCQPAHGLGGARAGKGRRALDVCAGSGVLALTAARFGARAVAVGVVDDSLRERMVMVEGRAAPAPPLQASPA
jgi:ubiquinone/menaquinone biosynthesis C-methylase UbiE